MVSTRINFVRRFVLTLVGTVAVMATGVQVGGQSNTLIRSTDLTYLGSFKVPTLSGDGLSYGGTAIAYNPANDSLFIVGHDVQQLTAEIKIPAIGGTATAIQGLSDAFAGKLSAIGGAEQKVGGNFVYGGKLYMTAFIYYDANSSQTVSHYSRPLTLTGGTVTGPVRAGSMGAGFYSGYMTDIPAEWQSRLGGPAITGNCCLSIISRTSYGPAAFAFNPVSLGTAQPLVYYPQDHTTLGDYGVSGSHPVFNGTSNVRGVVFPEGTATVLFVGSTGIGSFCYGEGSACGDQANPYKGNHAYPYRAYVWAYDANQLAAVKAGTKNPWDVVPYATWELPAIGSSLELDGIGGAAFDPKTSRLFISQKKGDGDKPLVHVYRLNVGATTTGAPQPPSNLRVTS